MPNRSTACSTSCVLILSMALAIDSGASAAPVGYRAVRLAGAGSVARLGAELGPERFLEVLKINRLDREHALAADTLILPDDSLSLMDISPWPHRLETIGAVPEVVFVSMRVQAFAAYERGDLARWGPISSGGPNSPSRSGFYTVGWKSRVHVSSVNSSWVMPWTVNIDREVGTALHQYSLPGVPVSHCCIRLLEEDAMWIFDWVSAWTLAADGHTVVAPGTPVILFGEYDYEAAPPWRRLAVDPHATDLTPAEIASALRFFLEPE